MLVSMTSPYVYENAALAARAVPHVAWALAELPADGRESWQSPAHEDYLMKLQLLRIHIREIEDALWWWVHRV